MGFFCCLLIVITVLLSAISCCAGDECCKETNSACSAEKQHSEEAANTCSPFMVCGSCTGFVVIPAYPDLNPVPVITGNYSIPYIQSYSGNYNLKFWQPPKIS